jgi:hypothetical protein
MNNRHYVCHFVVFKTLPCSYLIVPDENCAQFQLAAIPQFDASLRFNPHRFLGKRVPLMFVASIMSRCQAVASEILSNITILSGSKPKRYIYIIWVTQKMFEILSLASPQPEGCAKPSVYRGRPWTDTSAWVVAKSRQTQRSPTGSHWRHGGLQEPHWQRGGGSHSNSHEGDSGARGDPELAEDVLFFFPKKISLQ